MLVEIRRGDFVESSHLIEALVYGPGSKPIFRTGIKDFHFFPRSAAKPLQALMLLESGAFEAFQLDSHHLALASASHSGEAMHTQAISQWLSKLQLTEMDLRCGTHSPYDEKTLQQMWVDKKTPSALHNNCSGKHTGFLTVCKHLQMPIQDYHLYEHPLQQQIKSLMEKRLGETLTDYGIDGCSIPAFYMSFEAFARALSEMAREASTDDQSSSAKIFRAFAEHPFLTAGTDEYCSQRMHDHPGQLLLKIGAEGVMIAMVPAKQMAIVVKAKDGAERAIEAAMTHLLQEFAGFSMRPTAPIRNRAGIDVGSVRINLG